jgi:hypothetical protein
MKRIISNTILIATVFLISSCDSLLNVKPQSTITGEVYFTNEGDFEPYVTGIYNSMRNFSSTTDALVYGTERSEELVPAINARFSNSAYPQTITASNGAINYQSVYAGIGNCNLLLKKIEAFPFASNPDTRKRIIAETYALRAFFYFYLTRIIGDAPLMLEAIENENVPLLARSSASDVMKQIFSDLDQSINTFKSVTSYTSKYRFTYNSALALKADAKLWNAKVLNGGATEFNDAISAITEIEKSGLSLNANFGNATSLRASANPEAILAAFHLREENANTYAGNAMPTLAMVSGALNLDSIPYGQFAGQGAYQLSPLIRALFTKNPSDKRIPFTYIVERRTTGNSYAWLVKYPGTKYADERIKDNDHVIYRLADMYLMKAEAYAATGNLVEATKYLNLVRKRAGIPDYVATSKPLLEKEILDERGRELCFENKRWFDLVRFHKGGTLDLYTYIPNLIGKKTPLFWPLNATVLGANPLLKQTEGY